MKISVDVDIYKE